MLVVPLLAIPLLVAATGQERIDSSNGPKADDIRRDDVKKPLKDGLPDKKGRSRSAPAAAPPFTPESEAAALKFVGENHRELGALLKQLKASSPEEYKRAIRDLFRTTEKLAQTKSI